MTDLDCTKLYGRMREICEGKSGLPACIEEEYRQIWSRPGYFRAKARWRVVKTPLGNLIAWFLSKLGFHSAKCSPCEGRKNKLNRFWVPAIRKC